VFCGITSACRVMVVRYISASGSMVRGTPNVA
jgi:hypothetical protein